MRENLNAAKLIVVPPERWVEYTIRSGWTIIEATISDGVGYLLIGGPVEPPPDFIKGER